MNGVRPPHVGHPSFPLDVRTIAARTADLRAALDAEGITLALHPGGELHPSAPARMRRAEFNAVAQGPPGARWVLLEVPFDGIDDAFLDACATVARPLRSLPGPRPHRRPPVRL